MKVRHLSLKMASNIALADFTLWMNPESSGKDAGEPRLLDNLTSDDFVGRVDEPFETSIDGTRMVLELVDVDVMDERYSPPGARRSFSLTFRGPAAPLLPQGTYTLSNATLGALSVFVVPLGPRDGVLRYEVVFN